MSIIIWVGERIENIINEQPGKDLSCGLSGRYWKHRKKKWRGYYIWENIIGKKVDTMKPCYRCGSTQVTMSRVFEEFPDRPLDKFEVRCYGVGCDASSGTFRTAKEAIEVWNRFSENPEIGT